MKIGFDAKRAFLNTSGLGNYSRSVIDSLIHYCPQYEYVLFTPGASEEIILKQDRAKFSIVTPKGIWKTFHSLWRSSKIIADLKKQKIDLYHGLSNELPFGIRRSRIKSIVTVHDLIFLRYPEFYSAANRSIYHRKSKRACEEADHIVAVSIQTKEDLIHFYPVPEEKISVIYPAVQNSFSEKATLEQLVGAQKKYLLPEKFVLCVGTIEERKNLLAAVRAISLIPKEEEVFLVVVGRETAYRKKVDDYIARHDLHDRVIFLKNIPNLQLPFIYMSAKVVLYPSRYEGFGLPVIEALACGTPVIANDLKVLREAGGDAATFMDTDDYPRVTEAIRNIINHEKIRIEVMKRAAGHLVKFGPRFQAEQLSILYSRLLSGASGQ